MQGPEHKAHAYAYLAKWYPDAGCEDFYRAVWRDPEIRERLEAQLRRTGAWATIEELVPATAA